MNGLPVLGPSLERLVADHGSALLQAEHVSPLRGAAMSRAAFRLRFADGSLIKGRWLETEVQAGTVWAMGQVLRRSWPRAPLARVLAWHGDALLEQWLPGDSLARAPACPGDLRKAGDLLGRLHRAAPAGTRPVDPAWIEESLHGAPLVAAGVLDAAVAAEAMRLARRAQPQAADWGWCHGDVCDENLLRVPRRGLWLIDNETIGEHWFDHDLARTWYRWPLAPDQWARVLDGYAQHRSTAAFARSFAFWAVSVLLRAAAFRLRNDLDTAPPLARLAALCHERSAA